MKVIEIKRSDGGVSIMRIADTADLEKTIIKWEATMDGVIAASYREIAEADVPTDRTHRNLWKVQ